MADDQGAKVVVTAELQAVCDVCVQVIDDGAGGVWIVPPTTLRRAPDSFTDEELETLPDEVYEALTARTRWRVTHTKCEKPAFGYWIDIDRIRTWAGYLSWTAHLLSKEWLPSTDWEHKVLDSLNPVSTSVVGIRPLSVRDPGHRHIGD